MADRLKVIVVDDDPTGSQTVHSCPLLLRWDLDTLRRALADPAPLLFVLANTRALAPEPARHRVHQIAANLRRALQEAEAAGTLRHWLIVSRGDSTLRSHFPLECEAIAAAFGDVAAATAADTGWALSAFDAVVLVPAFLPGGRTTVDGVHLLHGQPVHTTSFARDGLFGYGSSALPEWVAEKTAGRIPAAAVQRLGLAELEAAAAGPEGHQRLCRRLAGFEGGVCVAVDAERPQQLAALGAVVRELTAPAAAGRWGRPRRFLFQSAASLLNGLVPLPPQPRDAAGLAALCRRDDQVQRRPGLVLVGSHVPLADAQLEVLLADPGCSGVEIAVGRLARLLEGATPAELLASLEQAWLEQLQQVLASGRTPVLFSSRGEVPCRSAAERRRLGLELAALMARLAARLAPQLGYLISKGGITTHTLLADGLACPQVALQGQLLPGLSLVLTPAAAVVADLPVVTFPGNLGDASTLHQAWRLLEDGAGGADGGALAGTCSR